MQIAVFLLYIQSVFMVLAGGFFNLLGIALIAGQVAAAFGIANEKRWAYWLGVLIAALGLVPFILSVANNGIDSAFSIGFLINLMMPAALFALLLHPQSRDYQRIWFS